MRLVMGPKKELTKHFTGSESDKVPLSEKAPHYSRKCLHINGLPSPKLKSQMYD